MKVLRTAILILVLVSLALVFVNCEQNSGTGTSGGVNLEYIGNITLTAYRTQLYVVPGVPDTTTITATVTNDSGTAVPNIPVQFSTPNIGSISNSLDSTDFEGKVRVVFNTQGQTGNALITATVISGNATKTGSLGINVFPLTGIAHRITLTLDPSMVYTTGIIEDSVKATVRVFDSTNVGIPDMHVNLSTTVGVVAYPDLTDNSGTTISYIFTNQDTGMGIVRASVYTYLPDSTENLNWPGLDPVTQIVVPGQAKGPGPELPPHTIYNVYEIFDTDTFYVMPMDDQIGQVVVSAVPSQMTVQNNAVDSATVTAYVLDESNAGIGGVPVQFSSNIGILSSNLVYTLSNGIATVTFKNLPNQTGIAVIEARVGNMTGSDSIIVLPPSGPNGSLWLFTDTYVIYADGGITKAHMTALLKDADNQVIMLAPIIFTADMGTIASPVNTDSTGQARSDFTGLTIPTFPDSAMVIAKYPSMNLADTLRIMIAPERTVDHVVVNTGSNYMQANGFDSTRVDATVWLEDNELAPPGTEVNFNIIGNHGGMFTSGSLGMVGDNGTATVYYRSGMSTGTDTLSAECEGVLSNFVPIVLHAGPPSVISISSDTTMLYVGSTTTATITAELRDTTGNMVGNNFPVFFTTTLGSITPLSAPTVNGVATAHLQASTVAGGALVKATFGALSCSTLVQFVATGPANISLSSDTSQITVQGGGSINYAYITAVVFDAAGNPVQVPAMVHFQIVAGLPGGGVNINNHNLEDSTFTNGGTATVVLNAGTVSGPVQIKAWTPNPENPQWPPIWAQQSLVTITAGPPAYISINSMSDPQDGGGDTWRVEVSSLVLDAYANPVPDNVSVSYYLLPDSIAQISGAGFTGNLNWSGNAYPGVSFTTLTYHSDETFNDVDVFAYCMVGEDSIIGHTLYPLPLAGGQLWLSVDPIAWNFDHPPYGPAGNPARMKCEATLKDGHNRLIDDGDIHFFSTRGYFYLVQYPQQGIIPVSHEITGPGGLVNSDSTGVATLWLITTINQAFPDMTATEMTGQVHCQVTQFPDITSTSVTVTYTKDAD
jgi:hypothetical protein